MGVDVEKSSYCRVLHCADDVSFPSLFVLYLLSNVIANAALKPLSGKVSYGTIMENYVGFLVFLMVTESFQNHLLSFLQSSFFVLHYLLPICGFCRTGRVIIITTH